MFFFSNRSINWFAQPVLFTAAFRLKIQFISFYSLCYRSIDRCLAYFNTIHFNVFSLLFYSPKFIRYLPKFISNIQTTIRWDIYERKILYCIVGWTVFLPLFIYIHFAYMHKRCFYLHCLVSHAFDTNNLLVVSSLKFQIRTP